MVQVQGLQDLIECRFVSLAVAAGGVMKARVILCEGKLTNIRPRTIPVSKI